MAPKLPGHGERRGGQAVLEGPGGIARFVLDPDVAQAERRRGQQRRIALAQAHGVGGDGRQERVPAPHRGRPARRIVAAAVLARNRVIGNGEIGRRARLAAGRAILGESIDGIAGAATNADQRTGNGHRPPRWRPRCGASTARNAVVRAAMIRYGAGPPNRQEFHRDQPRPCPAVDRLFRRLSRRHQGGGPRRSRRGRHPAAQGQAVGRPARAHRGADGRRRSGRACCRPCPSCAGPRR